MSTPSESDSKLFSRRDALRVSATGAAVALTGLGPVSLALADIEPTPGETPGPYWVDEMLNRADIRSDPSNGHKQPGLPLRLGFKISQLNHGVASPLPGAYLDLWQCNAAGVYSDETSQGTRGQKWLRGYQVTDSNGIARFITIYPGWYPGRTVHIHGRVRMFEGDRVTFNFTTQFYFYDEVTDWIFSHIAPYNARQNRSTRNNQDSIYRGGDPDGDPPSNSGSYLMLNLARDGNAVRGTFHIYVDLNNGLVLGQPYRPGQGLYMAMNRPAFHEADHTEEFGGGRPPAIDTHLV